MTEKTTSFRVNWYRSPVDKDTLQQLNRRSNFRGLLQTVPFMALIVCTGAAAVYATGRWPWPIVLLMLWIHGTCFAFILNAVHELSHGTVFKSRWLNTAFLRLFDFISWHDSVYFRTSHKRHHRYTLHPPHDLEVTLPIRYTLRNYLMQAFVDPLGLYAVVKTNILHASGKLLGEWENRIFAEEGPEAQRQLARWARIRLIGHALIIGGSVYYGYYMIPLVTTFARFYGNGLMFLCNNTQHVGLRNNIPDFRLCARTIYLNPLLRFLYWHMNYHIEHHSYAAVPCYNLKSMHAAIKDDLPPTPNGLHAAWMHIIDVMKRQDADPDYQYSAPLPEPAEKPQQATQSPFA